MEIIKEKYCINCKRMLPESFFYKLKILKLNSYCKECCRQSILEKQHNFKTECVTYKGNHCCECGYNRCVSALEFHHINPNEKEIMFSHSNITVFDEKIKQELDKCILVCVNCHRLIHSTDTTINYLNIVTENKRYCNNCKQDLPLLCFYQIRGKDGYSSYCKECERIKVVERQQRFKKQCVEYKNGRCYFCEYNLYLGALEFHHIDQDEKKFNISSKRRVVLSDEVKDELDKCILVCGNCHREIIAFSILPSLVSNYIEVTNLVSLLRFTKFWSRSNNSLSNTENTFSHFPSPNPFLVIFLTSTILEGN